MADDTITDKEVWTYGGKIVSSDRLRDLWIDKNDKQMVFKLPANVIGGKYWVQVERPDDTTIVRGKPSYTGQRTDTPGLLTHLVVQDMGERQKHAALRKAKNEDDPLTEALQPLIEYARKARTAPQRQALIATVVDTIYRNSW